MYKKFENWLKKIRNRLSLELEEIFGEKYVVNSESLNQSIASTADNLVDLLLDTKSADSDYLYNLGGEFFTLGSNSVRKEILPVLDIIIKYRGSDFDYTYRAKTKIRIANNLEESGSINLYRSAIEDLNQINNNKDIEIFNLLYGYAEVSLAVCLDNNESNILFKDSIKKLENSLMIKPNKMTYQSLGNAYYGIESNSLDEQEFNLDKVIENIENSLKFGADSEDYLLLGLAHMDLGEDKFDTEEKQILKTKSITYFRKSYELEPNDDVLKYINELDSESF